MPDALLTPELLRRLEQFQLLAARRAKSSAKGERRSRARGQSVEFADYRNYVHGDDFRYLDWNLYGRLERLFLKLYEEERELPVRIFLDASESMTFGEPRKFDFARQVAAAIGYVALSGFDRVSVIPFPDLGQWPGRRTRPPRTLELAARGALRSVRGKKSAIQFFQNLSALTAGGPANLNQALRRGALEARQAGVAVVLSDFLDPAGYETGLTALVGRGFQVDLVQILAPDELSPTTFGDLRLVDSETGGHAGSDLRALPAEGLPADGAELSAAPARVLPGPRHQLLHRQLEHRPGGTAAETTAAGGGVGMKADATSSRPQSPLSSPPRIPVVVVFYLLKRKRVVKLVSSTCSGRSFSRRPRPARRSRSSARTGCSFCRSFCSLLAVLALSRPYFATKAKPAAVARRHPRRLGLDAGHR